VLILLFLSFVSVSALSPTDNVDYPNYFIDNTYNLNRWIPINIILEDSSLFVHVGEKFPLSGNTIKYNHFYLEELDVPVPMIYPPVRVFQAKNTGNTTVFIITNNINESITITKVRVNIQT